MQTTSSFGASCATGSGALAPPRSRAAVPPLQNLDRIIEAKRDAIVRAWHRKDRARTDAEYQDADDRLVKLCNELADLAAQAKGRVPSVEA